MDTLEALKTLLDETLNLNGASAAWSEQTTLLGSLPELDSLAITHVITAMEGRFGFQVYDDEINADMFATLGALCEFVTQKLAQK